MQNSCSIEEFPLHKTEVSDIPNHIDDFAAIDDIDVPWRDIHRYKTKKNKRQNVVWPTLSETTADLVHESNTRNVDDMIRAATRPLHSEPVMPETLSSWPFAVNI